MFISETEILARAITAWESAEWRAVKGETTPQPQTYHPSGNRNIASNENGICWFPNVLLFNVAPYTSPKEFIPKFYVGEIHLRYKSPETHKYHLCTYGIYLDGTVELWAD